MGLSRRRRSQRGSAGLDRSALRALVKDCLGEVLAGGSVGVVRTPPGDATHYRVVDGDILVEVEMMPHGERVSARLAALVGGPTRGIWMIPDPETEVVVCFQAGEFEADPYIVGILPSGNAPAGLVPGKVVVIGADVLVDASGTVNIGGDGLSAAQDGVVTASGVDPFTGATYGALGNASSKVRAKKS